MGTGRKGGGLLSPHTGGCFSLGEGKQKKWRSQPNDMNIFIQYYLSYSSFSQFSCRLINPSKSDIVNNSAINKKKNQWKNLIIDKYKLELQYADNVQ